MLQIVKNVIDFRELMRVLVWKTIALRYKQTYLGLVWTVLKPLTFMVTFTLVRSFIGIDSGKIPYALLAFAALVPWTFFQEATSESVTSVVGHATLIRKIYLPRELFPIASVLTKVVEFGINLLVLCLLMGWYGVGPTMQCLWVPVIMLYMILAALTVGFAGAAINVYYRDVGALLPTALFIMMFVSPIMYPFAIVKENLLVAHSSGQWSEALYFLYTMNPMAGIVDAFQRIMLMGLPPDPSAIWPGLTLVLLLLPVSHAIFRRAETHFADVV